MSLNRHTLLPLDDVAAALQARGVKNGHGRLSQYHYHPVPDSGAQRYGCQGRPLKRDLKKLFLGESCRILKIARAQKGKPVLTISHNSVFTYSLTEAFEDMLYAKTMKEVSLDNLLLRINKITKAFIPEYTGLSNVPISCRTAAVRVSR